MSHQKQQDGIVLRTNLAMSPITAALRNGLVKSEFVSFDFCGPTVAHDGFRAMVRDNAYDAGELALTTFLQGKEYGRSWSLLPAVLSGGFQHGCIASNVDGKKIRSPKDLEGGRVAARSYTQTTAMWVRGILQHEHEVHLDKITWVSQDDCHFDEYRDPPNTELVDGAKSPDMMLLNVEVDAAIMGRDYIPKDPRIHFVIPDPDAAARSWFNENRAIPINHLFVISSEIARARPAVVAEVYRLLKASKEMANISPMQDTRPFGFEALRRSIEIGIELAAEQRIITRGFSIDTLYEDTRSAICGEQ